MAATLGDRQALVARELTKLHEETIEGTCSELAAYYEKKPPKGEIVIVVHPRGGQAASDEDLEAFLQTELETQSVKDAAASAAAILGVAKNRAYQAALSLKKRS